MRAAACLLLIAAPAAAQDEASLRSVDARQHEAAKVSDSAALFAMAHPGFRLFSPGGYLAGRERLKTTLIPAGPGFTRFERMIESATLAIPGPVGIVMGREVMARAGQEPVTLRFTNIWLWQDGRWQWLARHAQAEQVQGPK